jgi:hypothetical protein
MAKVPADVRKAVIKEVVGRLDTARWEEVSPSTASEMYDRFVKDPKIGGRLSPYMPAEKIRVWIKDGPAKEYRRSLEGIGPIASFTKRMYPGPESVVRLALGDQWLPKPDTIEEKPMRCFAEGPDGQSMFVIWGPLSAIQGMIWNSCLIRAEDSAKPITIVVTKPNSASLPTDDWKLVTALCRIVGADCKQVTYAAIRKPGS